MLTKLKKLYRAFMLGVISLADYESKLKECETEWRKACQIKK